MSGGTFDGKDIHIPQIATEIEEIVENNNKPDGMHLSSKTIDRFLEAMGLLLRAGVLVHRIDYLLAGDDSEESFHQRLKEDMDSLKAWEPWIETNAPTTEAVDNKGLTATSPEFKEFLKTGKPWNGPLPGGWR